MLNRLLVLKSRKPSGPGNRESRVAGSVEALAGGGGGGGVGVASGGNSGGAESTVLSVFLRRFACAGSDAAASSPLGLFDFDDTRVVVVGDAGIGVVAASGRGGGGGGGPVAASGGGGGATGSVTMAEA